MSVAPILAKAELRSKAGTAIMALTPTRADSIHLLILAAQFQSTARRE